MRFPVGRLERTQSVYRVQGDQAVDLSLRFPAVGTNLWALIKSSDLVASIRNTSDLGTPVNVDAIVPSLPMDRSGTIIYLGLNYTDHIKEGGYDIPDYPALFIRGHKSIMPAGTPMIRPSCSEKLGDVFDVEIENIGICSRPTINEADLLKTAAKSNKE